MKRLIMFSLPLLAFVLAFSPVTSFKVSGKITDENGNTLSGVVVKVKGTTTAAVSASGGNS